LVLIQPSPMIIHRGCRETPVPFEIMYWLMYRYLIDIVTNPFIVDTEDERIYAFHFSVYLKVRYSQSLSGFSQ